MRILKNVLRLFLLIATLQSAVYAQSVDPQKISDSALLNAKKFHQQAKYQNLEIFSGNVFDGYLKSIKGSPYFMYNDFVNANITFRGVEYFDMPVMYDIYIKTLVLRHHNNYMNIAIENEGIEKFEIGKYKFKHYKKGEIKGLDPGIYRIIEDGKYTNIVNDGVELVEKINQTIDREFFVKNYYFLVKNNEAFYIRNQGDFLQLMDMTKKEFKEVNKVAQLKWKKNKEKLIKLVTSYKNSQ